MKITITIEIEDETDKAEPTASGSYKGLERHGKRWRFRISRDGAQKWIFVPDEHQEPEEAFGWMEAYRASHGYQNDGPGRPRTVPPARVFPE